jgi:transcriptional regulator with XRE-family HTH domain
MNLRSPLASVIKAIRKYRGKTQEDFSLVSSRTYLSTLERGLKSPTFDKLVEIAEVLEVHPASLVILAYCATSPSENCTEQIDQVAIEAKLLASICFNVNTA